MIIPGTTPEHEFELPIDTALLKSVKVIYGQRDKELFYRRTEDCVLDGKFLRVQLTQEETFLFDSNWMAQVIIRALTHNDEALSTEEPITIPVAKCHDKNKEVLK